MWSDAAENKERSDPRSRRRGLSADVFVARSHSWLYEKLLEHAVLEEEVARLTESRRQADLIIYLDPPWPDPEAPDKLRRFRSRDLRRLCMYSQRDVPLPWAPGMYASLASPRARAGQSGGFYVSHHHREPRSGFFDDLERARDVERDLLWGFMGTLSNHRVRQQLAELSDTEAIVRDTQRFSDVIRWGWDSTYSAEGRKAFSDYAAILGRSSFVVCPRGVGTGSIRLFEALQVGRCPVIVSDGWLPPPLVDWASCSIRVPEADVVHLPAILRSRESEAEALGREGRRVWECLFSPERQLATLLHGCLDMHGAAPGLARLTQPLLMLGDQATLRSFAHRGREAARRTLPPGT